MTPRVMIVEDEEPLALMLRYNLEAEGYAVDMVERGDDAETRLRVRRISISTRSKVKSSWAGRGLAPRAPLPSRPPLTDAGLIQINSGLQTRRY